MAAEASHSPVQTTRMAYSALLLVVIPELAHKASAAEDNREAHGRKDAVVPELERVARGLEGVHAGSRHVAHDGEDGDGGVAVPERDAEASTLAHVLQELQEEVEAADQRREEQSAGDEGDERGDGGRELAEQAVAYADRGGSDGGEHDITAGDFRARVGGDFDLSHCKNLSLFGLRIRWKLAKSPQETFFSRLLRMRSIALLAPTTKIQEAPTRGIAAMSPTSP